MRDLDARPIELAAMRGLAWPTETQTPWLVTAIARARDRGE
jgi:hypothetical protein